MNAENLTDPLSKFRFKNHIIDTTLPTDISYGQTGVGDLDNDGKPEYILGARVGPLYCYKRHDDGQWQRFTISEKSPGSVGGICVDIDGDGWMDYISGGGWYRNSRDLNKPFELHVFDEKIWDVHDIFMGDIDGDGEDEVVIMSDRRDVSWYKIPKDPINDPWPCTHIGKAVHSGIALGDIDGDGDLDIVRTDIWFENVNGDGSKWVEHPIGPNTPPPPDFCEGFTFNATRCHVLDMTRNGKQNDVVFCDAEIPGGKVWWMENVNGDGSKWVRHEIALPLNPRRGAFHGLCVGDFDGDGDVDVFAAEMEAVGGNAPPRYRIWENVDGKGLKWKEHVILDANLGGHEPVIADFTGNGKMDIIAKPWHASPDNALGGKMFVLFLENVSPSVQ